MGIGLACCNITNSWGILALSQMSVMTPVLGRVFSNDPIANSISQLNKVRFKPEFLSKIAISDLEIYTCLNCLGARQ